jgi:hypothetical protein
MSLITLAHAMHRSRTLTRTLLILVAITAGIVGGLLAMHSLNTHPTGPGHADTVAAAPADPGSHHTDAAPAPAGAPASGCVDCSGSGNMSWMTCVLALLVTLLLIARFHRGSWRGSTPYVASLLAAILPARARPLRPPSLTVLCISRT